MAPNLNQMTAKQLESLGMKRCPFNANHIVKDSRFQRHLSDCLSNLNTTNQMKWMSCPFNASHYVTEVDYQNHLILCPDNKPYVRDIWDEIRDASNGSVIYFLFLTLSPIVCNLRMCSTIGC